MADLASYFNAKLHRLTTLLIPNLFFLALNVNPASETLRLAPSLWEIRTSTRIAAMSQSFSRHLTECIETGEVDPSSILENSRNRSVSD